MGNHPQSWKTYSCPTSASQEAFSLINRRVFLFRVPLFFVILEENNWFSVHFGVSGSLLGDLWAPLQWPAPFTGQDLGALGGAAGASVRGAAVITAPLPELEPMWLSKPVWWIPKFWGVKEFTHVRTYFSGWIGMFGQGGTHGHMSGL